MLQADIKEQLLQANRLAEEEIASIKNKAGADKAFLEKHLKKYIAYKLLLGDAEIDGTINEMIRESVARSLNVAKEKVTKVDQPARCDGSTTVLSKRILLFLSIQRELKIQFPPDKTALIETTDDLAGLVHHLLGNTTCDE